MESTFRFNKTHERFEGRKFSLVVQTCKDGLLRGMVFIQCGAPSQSHREMVFVMVFVRSLVDHGLFVHFGKVKGSSVTDNYCLQ